LGVERQFQYFRHRFLIEGNFLMGVCFSFYAASTTKTARNNKTTFKNVNSANKDI
jgi:hypothetical protein